MQLKKEARSTAVLLLALIASVFLLAATPSNARPPSSVVRAEVIAEVQPLGYTVTAVAIEYREKIYLSHARIPRSVFSVVATLLGPGGSVAPRTVTRIYTNNRAARAASGKAGRYLIVELGAADANAAVTYYTPATAHTGLYPLRGAYSITQKASIRDRSGRVVLPVSSTPVRNTGVITPVIDDFSKESFTSSAGVTLNYRFFQPEQRQGTLYPLVLALHGFGERGSDNTAQVVANQLAYAFAQPSRQRKDPSFVIAPQAPLQPPPELFIWNPPAIQQTLIELVQQAIANYPIDPKRIYLTGISMGSIGAWNMLPKFPHTFAAALVAAGQGDPADAPELKDIPIWAVHSADDPTLLYDTPYSDKAIVDAIAATGTPVTYGSWPGDLPLDQANARAAALWQNAVEHGSHTLFTTYPPGTTPGFPHFSWVPMYESSVMLDWLFSQTLN